MSTLTDRAFRAMASDCRIVTDLHEAVDDAVERVHLLEARWSRFISSSEVSRINDSAGTLALTSPETYTLFRTAQLAREWTEGRFNPLMLDQLERAGYGPGGPGTPHLGDTRPTSGGSQSDIDLYPELPAVVIPSGTRFDPGGIGKGLAADLVCEELIARGAATVMVDLGGDLRVAGRPWCGDRWTVELAAPQDRDATMGSLTLAGDGAVATSSVLSKRWRSGADAMHHLLDPSTGQPSTTDLLTASVTAPSAWQAEVAAKVGLLAGSLGFAALMERLGLHGVAVTRDGRPISTTDTDPRATATVADSEGPSTWN
jgi:thiamine biosynthesis lipoprotein